MAATPVPLDFPAVAPESLEAALAGLREAAPQVRQAHYERLVFPFAVRQAHARAELAPRARLLVVPVGTQPYSPLLAVLSCKADRVALLVTEPQDGAGGEAGIGSEGSRATGERVIATLESNGVLKPEFIQVSSIGDGTSGEMVAHAVAAALFFAGDPWASEVTIDISGGRKSTTAALGGIASALGFRVSYIEGRHVVGGYYADERRHELADVAALLEVDRRYAARQLLRAGAWSAAAAELRGVLSSTLAPPAAGLLLRFAEAMLALTTPSDDAEAPTLTDLASDIGRDPDWGEAANLLGEGPLRLLSGTTPCELAADLLELLERMGAWR